MGECREGKMGVHRGGSDKWGGGSGEGCGIWVLGVKGWRKRGGESEGVEEERVRVKGWRKRESEGWM